MVCLKSEDTGKTGQLLTLDGNSDFSGNSALDTRASGYKFVFSDCEVQATLFDRVLLTVVTAHGLRSAV